MASSAVRYDSTPTSSPPLPARIEPPGLLASLTVVGIPLAVAAQLTAENWKGLGQPGRARQSVVWMVIGIIAIVVAIGLAIAGLPLGAGSSLILWFGTVIGWYYHQVRPQMKIIAEKRAAGAELFVGSATRLVGIWVASFLFWGMIQYEVIEKLMPADAITFDAWLLSSPVQRDFANYRAAVQPLAAAEQSAIGALQGALAQASNPGVLRAELHQKAIPQLEAWLQRARAVQPLTPPIQQAHAAYIASMQAKLDGAQLLLTGRDDARTVAAFNAKLTEAQQHAETFKRLILAARAQ